MRVCPDRNAEGACQTEVGELELPSSVNEQVLGLQIAMQNAVGVAEGDAPNELVEIGLEKTGEQVRGQHRSRKSAIAP